MPEILQPNSYYANTLPGVGIEYGSVIQELEPGQRVSCPQNEVLLFGDDLQARVEDLVHHGGIEYRDPKDYPGKISNMVEVLVSATELAAKGISLEIVNGNGHIGNAKAEAVGLKQIFSDREKQVLRKAASRKVELALDRPYALLPSRFTEKLENVTQLFDVENGRDGFKLINFSNTVVDGLALAKIMNAVRVMDQLTGGASTEELKVIAILPDTIPAWANEVTESAAGIGAKKMMAFAGGNGVLALNEDMFKHQQTINTGEITDTFTVSENDIESTMFHELTHLVENELIRRGDIRPSEAFGWNIQRDTMGFPVKGAATTFTSNQHNPAQYGRINDREDVAESAAAMFAGGDWAAALDDGRKQAITNLFAKRHSGMAGPSHLRCTEQNLQTITADKRLGMELVDGPVVFMPELTYRLSE